MSHPLSKRVLHHNSAEAGWYAASEAGKEIIYLRCILFDFGFEQDGPTKLHEDSTAVIATILSIEKGRHIEHTHTH
jgi:hypothetical protein